MRPRPALLLLVLCLCFGSASDLLSDEPDTVYWESSQLRHLESRSTELSEEQKQAIAILRQDAEAAMQRGPYSVTFKKDVPPSGDKHDYLSFSRYWWPNPETKDGLPYIRKDGQVNVEIRQRGDRDQVGLLVEDVESLALGAFLFDEQEYAIHAVKLIDSWFLAPETRMNPHLRFGQSVPGLAEGRGVGIIDTRGFIRLLDSVALLDSLGAIEQSDRVGLRKWFSEYLDWLLNSDLGRDEAQRGNNHGSWYAAQVASIAVFVGEDEKTKQIVREVAQRRIPEQFSSDGSQPAELERTQSLHYSFFNLEALSVVARIGERMGVDLWNPTPGNNGLRPGIEFLLPYVTAKKSWPYPKMKDYHLSRGTCNLLRMASTRFEDPTFVRPIAVTPLRRHDCRYSSLLFRSKDSPAAASDGAYVKVSEKTQPRPPKYQLPDISGYTIEGIRNRMPQSREGIAKIGPSEAETVLDETFRRERGKDLQRRQATEVTRVITVSGGALSLEEVCAQISDEDIISIDNGIVTLRLPILVRPGATLLIDGNYTPEVRLSTDKGAFLSNAGELFVVDSTITSWDEEMRTPTEFKSKGDFRPFISSYIRSHTYLANSRFLHLGFHAPTAYGLSFSSEPEREDPSKLNDWPTGEIIGCEFHGLYYGFYSFEARAVKIIDNTYSKCVLYGIDPHDRSTQLIIARNLAVDTLERHGIIGSRGISDSYIFDNVAHGNRGSGIMLDRQCTRNIVCRNKVFDNGQGIAVYESPSNVIADNVVVQNVKSGVRIRNSVDIDVFDNEIVANGDYGLEVSSKRLDDHQKRNERGDTYTQRVSVRVFKNTATGNRGGIIKGSNVDRLLLSEFEVQTNLQDLKAQTGMDSISLYPRTKYKFGSELKKSAAELSRVFDEKVQAVEYLQVSSN